MSQSLAEVGLDETATITEIASKLALSVGDTCVISLFSENGSLVPAAARATDPRVELAVRLAFPLVNISDDDPYLTGEAISTSQAVQVYGSNDVVLASSRAALTELFRATQAQSLLVVPMHCLRDAQVPRRGQVIGVVYMMRSSPDGYASDEVTGLQEVADRAGLALEAAQLHRTIEAGERKFRATFKDAPFGIALADLAGEGRFIDVNDEFCRLTMYDHEQIVAVPPLSLVHSDDRAGTAAALAALSPREAPRYEGDVGFLRADGSVFRARLTASATDLGGDGRQVVVHVEDITEKALASNALATSEERFRSTFDHSPAGLATISLEREGPGQLVRVNPSLCDIAGFDAHQLLTMTVDDLFEASTDDTRAIAGGALVKDLVRTNGRRLCRCKRADNQVTWVQVSVVELPGLPRQALVQVDDVTAQKLAEEDLAHRALHDHLTGLANRHLAMDHLRLALKQLARTGGAVAVMYLDLDLFKRINDSLGHEGGDEALRQVGARLASAVRAPDTAARHGGDEFLVICSVKDEPSVARIVERVENALSQPVIVANKPVEVTASIGLAVTDHSSADPDELLRQADAALYEAKHRGRHRWQAYNETLHHRARERQTVELDLRRALKHDLFRVHYQPIFDLASGRLAGAEALLRMEQPSGELVYPASFMDVAEESDLIRPIGDWVLQRSCAQLAEWRPPLGFHLAVNLSGRQLSDLAVTGRILERIRQCGLEPSQLVLELTEGVLIDGGAMVVKELNRLKDAGVHLAIDDFGTGYCSLTYLERFPVDTVKIDRSFVAGLGVNTHATAIVEAVVALARKLELTAIAEGIEKPEQADTLRELGCQQGQGFLLGVPMVPAVFATFLARQVSGQGRPDHCEAG